MHVGLQLLHQLVVLILGGVQVFAQLVELDHEVLLIVFSFFLHNFQLLGDFALVLQLGYFGEGAVPFLSNQLHLVDNTFKLMLQLVTLLNKLGD